MLQPAQVVDCGRHKQLGLHTALALRKAMSIGSVHSCDVSFVNQDVSCGGCAVPSMMSIEA